MPIKLASPLLALLLANAALGATLRPSTSVSDGSVRLSDLFDGALNDRIIGPGPEPGSRIVVEAAQLAAIARQFGIDWRPGSTADRAVIERPGRPFPRADVLAALRAALATAGISADAEVEMPAFTPPMVPADSSALAEVAQLEYDVVTGRFTAMLSITAAAMAPSHSRLSGRIVEMVDVAVATRHLTTGDVVGPGDAVLARLRATLVRTEVARQPAQAIGQEVHRPVGAGAPFPLAELGRPAAVLRGATVQMQLSSPGLQLSAQGLAMESGAIGERIHVLNPTSRAIVDAEIVATGRVRVSGGTPGQLPPGAPIPVRVAGR